MRKESRAVSWKAETQANPFFNVTPALVLYRVDNRWSWESIAVRRTFFFIALFWFIFTNCYLYFPSLSKITCPNSVFKCWLLRELREDLNHAVLCLIPSLKSKCTSTVWYCALCFSHLGGLERREFECLLSSVHHFCREDLA